MERRGGGMEGRRGGGEKLNLSQLKPNNTRWRNIEEGSILYGSGYPHRNAKTYLLTLDFPYQD